MNKNVKRFIAKALEASLDSDYKRVQIGSVVTKRGRVIATACNTQKSHPVQRHYDLIGKRVAPNHYLHSEINVLLRCGEADLTGAEMFVGRFERDGRLGNCAPCQACREAIRVYGIRRVYYTDNEGIKEYVP